MPDSGRYEKQPRPESIAAFIKYLSSKDDVSSVNQVKAQVATVVRDHSPSTLQVYLTNIYIVGEADVADILAETPEIDAIVTMSAWNSYSPQAKTAAAKQKVGLFTFKEFMTAVHLEGQRFLDHKEKVYEPPGRRVDPSA